MPSRKGLEQALTWLRSKMAEKDTLDAINAEVCYKVVADLREKRKVIGALYYQERRRNGVKRQYDPWHGSIENRGFIQIDDCDIPEEWK